MGYDAYRAKVSVIVVNWNTRDALRLCLRSLAQACSELDHEVVVVDNASTDGSPEMVEREFPGVACIRSPANVGFGAAANRGLAATQGEFALLINADVEVNAASVRALLAAARGAPRAGAVGPQLLSPDGSPQYSYSATYPESPDTTLRPLTDGCCECAWVIGACMMLRRAAVEDIGGFDERFFMYYEEIDLCREMTKRGWRVLYVPRACVVHALGRSSVQVPREETARRRLDSLVAYLRKHYPGRCERLRSRLALRAIRGLLAHGVARRIGGRRRAYHQERWLMYHVWCQRLLGADTWHGAVWGWLCGRMTPSERATDRGAGAGSPQAGRGRGPDT